MVVELTDSI